MAPKKSNEEAEIRKAAVAKLRRENVTFPSAVSEESLHSIYGPFMSQATKDHPATVVAPASTVPAGECFRFFVSYFLCGLCPPFSEFFSEIMASYGFRVLDFAPNAITQMAVFAHLCENFVGVVPNVPLFRHFFIPRIESDALSGSITWIPRAGKKQDYLEGRFHLKWSEWRGDWCWVIWPGHPEYCAERAAKVVKNPRWSDVGPHDDKLHLPLSRISTLRRKGLTLEMVGGDFLRRRVAPLQHRGGRYAWDFNGSVDPMRLYPGAKHNFTANELQTAIERIFNKDDKTSLPYEVIPLCRNSARSAIRAMMPDCNARGIQADWICPDMETIVNWSSSLTERSVRDESYLIRPIKSHEEKLVRKSLAGAAKTRTASGAGSSGMTDGASHNDPAEVSAGEEEGEEEEKEEPPVTRRQTRASIAKKSAAKRPAPTAPAGDPPSGKRRAGNVSRQSAAQEQVLPPRPPTPQPQPAQVPEPSVAPPTGGEALVRQLVPIAEERSKHPSSSSIIPGSTAGAVWRLELSSSEDEEE